MKQKLFRLAELSIIVFTLLGFITLLYAKTFYNYTTNVNKMSIPSENLIYAGNLTSNKTIYVVVDPLCPYCALEYFDLKKVKSYRIAYILFPLSIHKYSKELSSAILCKQSNTQRLLLLDKVISNQAFIDEIKKIASQKCKKGDELVSQNIKYIKSLGINKVPTMITPKGKIITGYRNINGSAI